MQEKSLIDKKYRVFEGLCMDAIISFLFGIVIFLFGFIWTKTEKKRRIKVRREKEKKLEFIDKKKEDNEFMEVQKGIVKSAGKLREENYYLKDGASNKEKNG